MRSRLRYGPVGAALTGGPAAMPTRMGPDMTFGQGPVLGGGGYSVGQMQQPEPVQMMASGGLVRRATAKKLGKACKR